MSNQLFEEVETVEEVTDKFTPEELAYFLAYHGAPEWAAKLLEELLYYRAQGRIQ